jgi:pimeloyl-ACP methyl ester carboxylesterase
VGTGRPARAWRVTSYVALPDGRDLAYEDYGDPDGTPVLSFHGGLSSRLDAAPAHQAALELGIRLVSPDRPGMGRSTYQPRRRLVDWPDDVAALTGALGIDSFAAMGWSAGGPYAALCAARLPGRVTSVALLSSAIPIDLFGTTRGLTTDDRLLLFLAQRAPRLAGSLVGWTIRDIPDRNLYRVMCRAFPAADRAVLEARGSATEAVAFVKESTRQGTLGPVADYRIFGEPWGFDLEEIAAPVHIWEGTDDHTGPPEYHEFLLDRLSSAALHLVPGEGHISLLTNQARAILSALVAQDQSAESMARWNVG